MIRVTLQIKPEVRAVLGKVGDNLQKAVRLLEENVELLRGFRELHPLETRVVEGTLGGVEIGLNPPGVTL